MPRKGKRQSRKLNARIADWEAIKGTHNGKICMVNKSGFTRPGSNKK